MIRRPAASPFPTPIVPEQAPAEEIPPEDNWIHHETPVPMEPNPTEEARNHPIYRTVAGIHRNAGWLLPFLFILLGAAIWYLWFFDKLGILFE